MTARCPVRLPAVPGPPEPPAKRQRLAAGYRKPGPKPPFSAQHSLGVSKDHREIQKTVDFRTTAIARLTARYLAREPRAVHDLPAEHGRSRISVQPRQFSACRPGEGRMSARRGVLIGAVV